MVDHAVPGLTQGSRLLSMGGVEEAAVKLSLFVNLISFRTILKLKMSGANGSIS